MKRAVDWLARGWAAYRRSPGRWIGAGAALWLAWLVPHLLNGIIPPIISNRSITWLDIFGPQAIGAQTVITAFYWSCLLGVMTMAVREKIGGRKGISAFVGGFFGGFFVLPFAILWEAFQPPDLASRAAMVAVSVIAWPLVSLGLWLLAAQPNKEQRKGLYRSFWRKYLPLLMLEAICALLLAVAWLPGGAGLVLVGPLRLLALAEAFGDIRAQ